MPLDAKSSKLYLGGGALPDEEKALKSTSPPEEGVLTDDPLENGEELKSVSWPLLPVTGVVEPDELETGNGEEPKSVS